MAGDHVLVSFGGALGTAPAADSWQCGVRMYNATADFTNQAWVDLPSYLTAIKVPLQTWMTSTSGTYGSLRADAHLDFIKVARIHRTTNATSGKASWTYRPAPDNPTVVTGVATTPGTAGVFPWFLSVAFSWTTVTNRGLGHTGRIYPPIAFPGSGATAANLPQAAVNDYVTKAKALLTALTKADTNSVTLSPCVASLKDGSLHQITGVRVGNVIDVQRRRKEQIPEQYTASVWP